MPEQPKYAYVTKYWATCGIQRVVAVKITDQGMLICKVKGCVNGRDYYHGEGREWHFALADALSHVEMLRSKKIASLKKQLAKIETLSVKVVEMEA